MSVGLVVNPLISGSLASLRICSRSAPSANTFVVIWSSVGPAGTVLAAVTGFIVSLERMPRTLVALLASRGDPKGRTCLPYFSAVPPQGTAKGVSHRPGWPGMTLLELGLAA